LLREAKVEGGRGRGRGSRTRGGYKQELKVI